MVCLNVIFAAREKNNNVYDDLTIASLGLYYLYKVRHLHTRERPVFFSPGCIILYCNVVFHARYNILPYIVIALGYFGSRSDDCISILLYYNVA